MIMSNDKVLDFLTWPPTDFFSIKNVQATTPFNNIVKTA